VLNDHHRNTLGHLDLGWTSVRIRTAAQVELLVAVLRGLAAFFVVLAEALVALG